MRIYAYVRINPDIEIELWKYVSFFSEKGYKIQKNRLIIEEVSIEKSINYRDKFLNLINFSLEEGDLLLIKSIDCLGSNFQEILSVIQKIETKKIKLICFDYSKHEINGDLRIFLLHILNLFSEFEKSLKNSPKKERHTVRRVGRPEILNDEQKAEVIDLFKKGNSVYYLAKHFSVTRTVIQRVLEKSSKRILL